MNDILIISNYYPPEKGAAANRIEQLALKLDQHGYQVSVVCPMPNYPTGSVFSKYKRKVVVNEICDGINVRRLWIYPSNSKNVIKRVVSTLSFSTGLALYLLVCKTPKKVIVQSPPLLLSFISVLILSLKKKKIILNVSDLWPSAAVELNALKAGTMSHKVLLFCERFIYNSATLILGQSNEIITHVHGMFPQKKCHLYRNFPERQHHEVIPEPGSEKPIKMFYAGLLGVAQGVFEVCQNITVDDAKMEFHIFGDGAERRVIEDYLQAHPNKRIIFHGMVDRNELKALLSSFDVALVPLKSRIYGSVPSKIFEYTALGIPILYFGGGEGETIVKDHDLGWVAAVGDYRSLNAVLKAICGIDNEEMNSIKRQVFEQSKMHFNLDRQIRELIEKDVF